MQKIIKILLMLVLGAVIALWQPQTIFLHQNYDPMLPLAFFIPLIICIFGIVWEIKEIREEKGSPPFFTKELDAGTEAQHRKEIREAERFMKKTKLEIRGTRFFGIHYEGDSLSLYNELKDNKEINLVANSKALPELKYRFVMKKTNKGLKIVNGDIFRSEAHYLLNPKKMPVSRSSTITIGGYDKEERERQQKMYEAAFGDWDERREESEKQAEEQRKKKEEEQRQNDILDSEMEELEYLEYMAAYINDEEDREDFLEEHGYYGF